MLIKKTTFSIPRPSKIYPNWGFWYENKPSGNPALDVVLSGHLMDLKIILKNGKTIDPLYLCRMEPLLKLTD
jgi:hypothetical protein